ncbi:MAG: shikimate dehydrogenase [Arachidicoccus sp.]|nr:shikimate dehydrogenase [Arachidicoccus sp.]
MQKFGIIGFPLSHSFSQKYFSQKFIDDHIADSIFEKFEMPDISAVEELIKDKELKGFCITLPYKKSIIHYLYESSDDVKETGACNCVRIIDGKLYGYNTDVIGFEKSFTQHLSTHHTKALILGTGGAAAAVEFVLKKLGIEYKFVSRNKTANNFSYDELNQAILEEYTVIVNCTPLGTFPNTDEAPLLPYQFITQQHYLFDMVYNPPLTKFLSLGKEKNATIQNGYDMLVFQAEENWKIWNE